MKSSLSDELAPEVEHERGGLRLAEITRRRTGELLRRLFELLMAEPDGLPAGSAVDAVRRSVVLSDYEAGEYPSGGQRFEKILRFATVDCVKAGWLHKDKGVWSITDGGKAAYAQFADPEAFYKEAVRLYHQWKSAKNATAVQPGDAADPDAIDQAIEKLSVSVDLAQEHAWTEISEFLHATDPFDFQRMCADLLEAMGYFISWISPPAKDDGIDIIAFTDPLGTVGPRIKVQVKRWQSKIDTEGLNAFMATMSQGDVGIYICLAGFTRDAQAKARSQESRRVTLMDAHRFFDLWVEHYGKLAEEARRRMPLKPVYFLAPAD